MIAADLGSRTEFESDGARSIEEKWRRSDILLLLHSHGVNMGAAVEEFKYPGRAKRLANLRRALPNRYAWKNKLGDCTDVLRRAVKRKLDLRPRQIAVCKC